MTPTRPKRFTCRRGGCTGRAGLDGGFCSRRCTMIDLRAMQGTAERHRIAMLGRQSQRKDEIERLLARVKLHANTERGRILLAFRLGKQADKSERYRGRLLLGQQMAMSARVQ